jgi:hypothetical protein
MLLRKSGGAQPHARSPIGQLLNPGGQTARLRFPKLKPAGEGSIVRSIPRHYAIYTRLQLLKVSNLDPCPLSSFQSMQSFCKEL